MAREIAETLAEYLERTIGRPQGVLTPDEAQCAVRGGDAGRGTGRTLCQARRRLRSVYSVPETGTGNAELVDEARYVFKEIARKGTAGLRKGEGTAGIERTRERQP